jgi:hypothetical protein
MKYKVLKKSISSRHILEEFNSFERGLCFFLAALMLVSVYTQNAFPQPKGFEYPNYSNNSNHTSPPAQKNSPSTPKSFQRQAADQNFIDQTTFSQNYGGIPLPQNRLPQNGLRSPRIVENIPNDFRAGRSFSERRTSQGALEAESSSNRKTLESWGIDVNKYINAQKNDSTKNEDGRNGGTGSVNSFNSSLVGQQTGAQSKNFFEKNSAATIFSGEARLTESPKVHILNATIGDDFMPELLEQPKQDQENQPEQSQSLRDRLANDFGDAAADPTVFADEKAPKPFKAMMIALEAGDDELAFDYARQYARYQRKFHERVDRVMDITQIAMEDEDILPKIDRSEEADYDGTLSLGGRGEKKENLKQEEVELASKNEIEKNIQSASSAYALSLDNKTRDILKRAEMVELGISDDEASLKIKEGEKALAAANREQKIVDEKTERRMIRTALSGKVPMDSKGFAAMYFFFRPNDTEAVAVGKELEKLYRANRENRMLNIVAFSMDRPSGDLVKYIQKKMGITFQIRDGSQLIKRLKVNESPSVVLFAPTDGKAFVVEGVKNALFYDEVSKMMQGRN